MGGVAQEAGRSTGGLFSRARLLQKKKTEILSALTRVEGALALSNIIKSKMRVILWVRRVGKGLR